MKKKNLDSGYRIGYQRVLARLPYVLTKYLKNSGS